MAQELSFRKGREGRSAHKSDNIFKKTNRTINKMSGFYFSLLVLFFIFVITFFLFFAPESATKVFKDAINISNLIDTSANCSDIMNPSCWTDSFFPKLQKTDNLTNALLIGMDTRDSGSGSGLMNTDTIMLASYDHKTGKVYLISFPRDLYVPYKINGKGPYNQKINAIYAAGETSKDKDGMDVLKQNIEDWLGIEIHYTAKVNFNTVIDIVNSLDGIKVNVEKDYTDVYPYKELPADLQKECTRATDLPAYCVFKFEKGEHQLDGEHALIYARMRQYSSDFDRARRQQDVVQAIKNKFLEGDLNVIQKAKFAWDTYSTISNQDNVKSNINYNDLLAGLRLIDKADLNPIQIVLDPTFGGGGYFVPDSVDEIYVLKIVGNSFVPVKNYINNLKDYPDLYREQANVLLANSTGLTKGKTLDLTKLDIPIKTLNYVVRTKSKESGTIIYVFDNTKVETLKFLKEYFNTSKVRLTPEEWEVKQSGYKEDILVVEGIAE